jgi:P27 family predicted phage terminase small subunit
MATGRRPKPGVIRDLEGNRGHRLIPTQPQGVGEPVCNPALQPDEQRFWWAIVDSLPAGLLSRADEQAIERMAVAWARFWDVRQKIQQLGMIVKGPNGPVRNPLLIIERDAREEMHRAGETLGLSPVARARITMSDNTLNEDPTEILLGGLEHGAWTDTLEGTGNESVVPFRKPKKKP